MNRTIQTTERRLNMCKNDHTKESGQIKPIKTNRIDDRKIKDINKEITDADKVAHQTGQDNTYARRKWQNAEIVKEEDTMKKCSDPRKEFNTSASNNFISRRRQLGLQPNRKNKR